jgi:hypothetical protein
MLGILGVLNTQMSTVMTVEKKFAQRAQPFSKLFYHKNCRKISATQGVHSQEPNPSSNIQHPLASLPWERELSLA